VHLLHITPTPSTGHHPSQAIVQLCFSMVRFRLSSREELLSQAHALRCFWLHVCLFSIHESALVMKYFLAQDVWVCAFLKYGNCVNLSYFSGMNR
jgi:hypothetical protein